jgi:hypothetical protein
MTASEVNGRMIHNHKHIWCLNLQAQTCRRYRQSYLKGGGRGEERGRDLRESVGRTCYATDLLRGPTDLYRWGATFMFRYWLQGTQIFRY